MKCHYEILNVARDADVSEIKSAYRKFALKWHPDKNLDNTEYAKEQFQLVQQAYEILSDPQERAWYDKHREQILRGANSEFEDNSLDVFQYFTTTCFKGYNDEENGFYTVYRNVFDQIIKEDMEFIEEKNDFIEIPRFGNSKSDYDSIVGPFYSYWMGYSTKKSYVWLDPYNIKDIKDRRYLKLIEKDNKKIRMKAKKERNDEIRNLVSFVRKRDKRVQEHTKLMEAKIFENRQKQEQLSKLKRLKRNRELNESGEQAEWAKFDNVVSQLEEIEKHLDKQFGESSTFEEESESEKNYNNLYCVACNKIFKTEKAFENHEISKKHKENVEKLKETMLQDEFDDEFENLEEIQSSLEEIDSNSESELIESSKKQKKKQKKPKNVIKDETIEDFELDLSTKTEEVDNSFGFETNKKQKKRSNKKNNASVKNNSEKIVKETVISENVPKSGKNSKNKVDLTELDTNHCCVTCKSQFQSKNKLFDHLKKTGHGVYLPNKNKKNVKEK